MFFPAVGWSFVPTFQSLLFAMHTVLEELTEELDKEISPELSCRSRAHKHLGWLSPVSAAAPIQTTPFLSFRTLLLLRFFFPSLDERTLPQYKRRSLSDSQQDHSHPFQHFPRITIQQHLHPSRFLSGKHPLHSPVLAWEVCVALKCHWSCSLVWQWSLWKPLVRDKDFATLDNL